MRSLRLAFAACRTVPALLLLVFPAQRRAPLNDARRRKIIESLKFDISSTMEALETVLASLELPDSGNYA